MGLICYQLEYRLKDLKDAKRVDAFNIVDFLTSSKESKLCRLVYDNEMCRYEPENFAINFGDDWSSTRNRGDRSPFVRGIECEGEIYEIKKDRKIVLRAGRLYKTSTGIYVTSGLFYDSGKIPFRNADGTPSKLMFQGKIDDVLFEFLTAGYEIRL